MYSPIITLTVSAMVYYTVFNGSAGNGSKIVPEVLGKTKVLYCPRSKIEVNRTLLSFPISRETLFDLLPTLP